MKVHYWFCLSSCKLVQSQSACKQLKFGTVIADTNNCWHSSSVFLFNVLHHSRKKQLGSVKYWYLDKLFQLSFKSVTTCLELNGISLSSLLLLSGIDLYRSLSLQNNGNHHFYFFSVVFLSAIWLQVCCWLFSSMLGP